MRDVALELPLGSLTVIRGRQCCDPAYPRIEALCDAFDNAAFARCIAAFEKDYHLVSGTHNPVLQLHQVTLHTEQFLEVASPMVAVLLRLGIQAGFSHCIKVAVFQLEFEFFVVAVGQIAPDSLDQVFFVRVQPQLLLLRLGLQQSMMLLIE